MNLKLLLTALFLFMLSPGIARAGTDDMHVIAKLTGLVEARTMHRHGSRVSFGPWKKVHLHDVLDSGMEVRSGPHASVWLQTGDEFYDPNKLPVDAHIFYYILASNSAVRLNTQGGGGDLVQTLHGHVTQQIMRGKVANATYYKNQR